MRAFTSLASPASVSRRHAPALMPRECALALRGRRRAGARFSALLRAAGLAVAMVKREHEHTHVKKISYEVRNYFSAGSGILGAQASHSCFGSVWRKNTAPDLARAVPGGLANSMPPVMNERSDSSSIWMPLSSPALTLSPLTSQKVEPSRTSAA